MPKLNMTPAALTTKFIGFIALFLALNCAFEPATAFGHAVTAFVVIAKSK